MNIFITNLPLDIDNDSLRDLFAAYGAVDLADVLRDRFNGYSKGKAFVEMPDAEEALQAIEQLNGAVINGQAIQVSKALAKAERPK